MDNGGGARIAPLSASRAASCDFLTLSDWLSWQQTLHPSTIDLGLTRLNRTLARLEWRRPRCPVITVGGTNGKGSSVALLNRILSEAGYRVGTFTSPHLLRYNERIVIADRRNLRRFAGRGFRAHRCGAWRSTR